MHAARQWVDAVRQHRHAMLFATLLATIAAGPLLSATRFDARILEFFLALSLLAALLPESGKRRLLIAAVVAAYAIRYLPLGGPGQAPETISLVLWSLVALVTAYRSLRYALSSARVDSEHVFAALNAYLVVGVFGGALLVALETVVPGSLLVQGKPFEQGLPMSDGIYFSFVTLATLGYGDIVPATPIARGFAVFEAVAGQFYLAVLVGRLVGLRTAVDSTKGEDR